MKTIVHFWLIQLNVNVVKLGCKEKGLYIKSSLMLFFYYQLKGLEHLKLHIICHIFISTVFVQFLICVEKIFYGYKVNWIKVKLKGHNGVLLAVVWKLLLGTAIGIAGQY